MGKGFIPRKSGAGGVDVTETTAVQADVLSGKTFFAGDENIKTGNIPSKGAQTFTPGTTNQTIAAGQYLSGTQTISGSGNLIAGNIRSGVNIFGVNGNVVPLPNFVNFKPLNYSAPLPANLGPGPTTLVAGNASAGFFGTATQAQFGRTMTQVMSDLGISEGTAQFTDDPLFKFIHNGKIKYINQRTIRHTITWDHIQARLVANSGNVYGGATLTFGGNSYKVRLMRGYGQVSENTNGTGNPNYNTGPLMTISYANTIGGNNGTNWPANTSPWSNNSPNEWNTLMFPIASATQSQTASTPNWASYSNISLQIAGGGTGRATLVQETRNNYTSRRIVRGANGLADSISFLSDSITTSAGCRLVFELI